MFGIGGGYSSSGGSGFLDGEVANYAALPAVAASAGKWYLVRASSGVWPINYKGIGTYYCDGVSWEKKTIPPTLTTAVGLNTTHRSSDGTDHSHVVLNDAHRSGDGSDHANVALNDTHRASDGKDHSDVVLNNTHRASNGSDHSFIDQSVVSGASPNFNGANFSGIDHGGLAGLSDNDHPQYLRGVHEDPSPELSGPLLARENNISMTPIDVVYDATTTTVDWSSGSNKAILKLEGNITNLVFNDPPPGFCNLVLVIQQSAAGNCLISNYGPAGSGDSDITWLTSDGNPITLRTAGLAFNVLALVFTGTDYLVVGS